MNGKTWIAIFSTALACLGADRAAAADPGFYLTASLGKGSEDPKSIGTNVGNSLGVFHVDPESVAVDDGGLAWGIGLGYRINRYVAGEVEYVDFGTTRVDEHYSVPNNSPFPFPTEFTLDYSSKVTGPALSVLGTLPVGGHVELYLRGGALFASREYSMGSIGTVDEKFASTVWLAGAGASWSFAKHWAVRAEYQRTGTLDETIVSGETKVERVTLGVLFKF